MTTPDPIIEAADRLHAAAQAVIEAIVFDDSGFEGQGGNGGLISRDTIRRADEARLAIHAYQRARDAAQEQTS